jgi:hypothetical protein
MERERGFMDVGLAKNLILEMKRHAPVALVPFFRGESLLHPQWYEVMEYAQELSIGDLQFTTNASLLGAENVERLLDLDLSFVSFSLDTLDRELYNSSRRGADFDLTVQNVMYFLKRRDERGGRTEVQVSAVETAEHKKGMAAFVDFWRSRADRVRVYVEHSSDGSPGSIDESLPDFDVRMPCLKVFSDMVVYWNGQVACCNHDWNRMVDGLPLGDVAESSIEKVWLDAPYARLREMHMNGDLDGVTPCQGCDHWKMYYMDSGYIGRTYYKKPQSDR